MQRAPSFCQLTRADGGSLPPGIRALSLLPRAPRQLGALALQEVRRCPRVVRRIPKMLAVYDDGRRFVCPAGDPMYAAVLCQGVWEPVETAAIRSLLRPGDCAVDVGANQGWHAIGMASVVGPSGRILAVEPLPAIADQLRRNMAMNPGLSVSVMQCALGASAGSSLLHLFRGLPAGHASTSTLGRQDYEQHEVPRRTLDEIVAETGISPVLVKVDVEGSDLEVLRGGRELAAGPRAPIWLLEVNWQVSRACGYEPADLLACLDEAGDYLSYRLKRSGAHPETDPRNAPHSAAWLVVPRRLLERMSHMNVVA